MFKLNRTYVYLVIIVFLLIFVPPILPFNIVYVLSFFAVIYLKNISTGEFRIQNERRFYAILVFVVYTIFIMSINLLLDNRDFTMNRIVTIYQVFVLIPMQYICSLAIKKKLQTIKGGITEIINFCVCAAVIQGILVLLAFLVPGIRSFFLDIILRHGGPARVYGNAEMMAYRGYGFADTLLDTFGYGMGLIAGFCILQTNWTKLTFLGFVFSLFATMLNSRTGLVIMVIAFVIKVTDCFINYLIQKRIKIRLKTGVFILCGLVGGIIALRLGVIGDMTLSWIMGGITSLFNFLTGTTAAYRLGSMRNSLFSKKFWKLPDSILGLVFGEGHTIYGVSDVLLHVHSDVGYVNYIWLVGIVGTVLLMGIIISIVISSFKKCVSKYEKLVILFIGISFFAMFVKGNVITHTAGTFISILICTVALDGKEAEVCDEIKSELEVVGERSVNE